MGNIIMKIKKQRLIQIIKEEIVLYKKKKALTEMLREKVRNILIQEISTGVTAYGGKKKGYVSKKQAELDKTRVMKKTDITKKHKAIAPKKATVDTKQSTLDTKKLATKTAAATKTTKADAVKKVEAKRDASASDIAKVEKAIKTLGELNYSKVIPLFVKMSKKDKYKDIFPELNYALSLLKNK